MSTWSDSDMKALNDMKALIDAIEHECQAHDLEIRRVLGIAKENGWGVFSSPELVWATPYVKAGTAIISNYDQY